MKTLYLLRHAKAEPEREEGDAKRPLAKRGREAAAAMGSYLARIEPPPELVLCSSSTRTRETLDEILAALPRRPRVLYEDALYLAEARRLYDRVRHLPESAESVLLIGHNPGLHQFAARLGPASASFADGFSTSALAVFRFDGAWSGLHAHAAQLVDYQTPKSLSRDLALESD